jgi:hypothetical protein
VLIEHGNRYDSWNAVPHDELRRLRSALSRREKPPPLPSIPGSELVKRAINKVKETHAFIDLLKPETAAAFPLLAVLKPSVFRQLQEVWDLYGRALAAGYFRFDADGIPTDKTNIGTAPQAEPTPREERFFELARYLGGEGEGRDMGAAQRLAGFVRLWKAARTPPEQAAQIDRLYKALRAFIDDHYLAFDTTREVQTYLKPARAAARRGFRFVIYGHTHLVKRVVLNEGAHYLNTGTWIDLMRLPNAVVHGPPPEAKRMLRAFADDLAHNRLDAYREHIPSFAHITDDERGDVRADLFLFHEPGKVERLADGTLRSFLA